jgi:hypothetical protein
MSLESKSRTAYNIETIFKDTRLRRVENSRECPIICYITFSAICFTWTLLHMMNIAKWYIVEANSERISHIKAWIFHRRSFFTQCAILYISAPKYFQYLLCGHTTLVVKASIILPGISFALLHSEISDLRVHPCNMSMIGRQFLWQCVQNGCRWQFRHSSLYVRNRWRLGWKLWWR